MTTAAKLSDLQERGFCVLRRHLPTHLIEVCRDSFWPVLAAYLGKHQPNRGLNRYFLPMPFSAGCFDARFFFDANVLSIVRSCMGERIVADQWGCDVPLRGSDYQDVHIDYQRPLF